MKSQIEPVSLPREVNVPAARLEANSSAAHLSPSPPPSHRLLPGSVDLRPPPIAQDKRSAISGSHQERF
ncbi:hypothetical protein RRG08_009627 [Elysia crispata]|uniref:Uncharacterized protein n=1 Tax=Elysia crispata TaxID=231223 RepID=A0AAE0XTP5_9GAST|nr:hypothetical protein RRG08_009627 [Elysia crispata]